MKMMFQMFACVIFVLFCFVELKGYSWDSNQTAPKPEIYSRRGGGGGSTSIWYFSSK